MSIELVDTHTHLNDAKFQADVKETVQRARAVGVTRMINMGDTLESSERAVNLAESYEGLYAGVGIHPEEAFEMTSREDDILAGWTDMPKVVAIGEIGLDYYWDDTYKAEQKELFRRQIELALELSKPIIVHDREAHGDSLELVSRYPELRGVFHCFSGSAEMAKELLRRGWYLGFDGPVTYKNARKALEVMELCPIDRLLLETDSPYLSPVPMRGKRNDSRNLKYIAEKIAEVKGCAAEDIACAAYENGRRLFEI